MIQINPGNSERPASGTNNTRQMKAHGKMFNIRPSNRSFSGSLRIGVNLSRRTHSAHLGIYKKFDKM